MAFSVRNARVEQKARAYAARHGTTLTGALDRALDKASAQEKLDQERDFDAWYAQLKEIQAEVAQLPDSGLSEQDIMGWGEHGLPT